MKKLVITVIALTLAFCLSACGGGDDGGNEPTTLDLTAVSSAIEGGGLFIDSLEPISSERIGDTAGIDTGDCKSAEYHMGAGATGEEWGVFECNTVDGAKALVKSLETHRDELLKTYESYAPDAVPRIKNAVIKRAGQYVIFITADKYDEAKTLVDGLLK